VALFGCVLEGEEPWMPVVGPTGQTGGASNETLGTACLLALDGESTALISGHRECEYPWATLCYSGDFDDNAAGSVCCSDEEPGADCEIHEAMLTPLGPTVMECDAGQVHVCDY
jgi:hypothetical protein